MEQRAQEAIEFFQNEDDEPKHQQCSDESDDNGPINEPTKPGEIAEATDSHEVVECMELEVTKPDSHPTEPVDLPTMAAESPEMENLESIVGEQLLSSVEEQEDFSNIPGPSSNNIVLHTEKSKLDMELDQMISDDNRRKKLLALSLALDADAAPKLSGDNDMIIDLDLNIVKPREKSGVEELQERFLCHAMKKPTADSQSSKLSIFNTESGSLETISHYSETIIKADPKPGQAYTRLKNVLGKKISEKRRETMLKRVEEERQKRLEMESDDDEEEMEEYSDCGAEESDHEAIGETEMEKETPQEDELIVSGSEVNEVLPENDLIDNQAEEDKDDEDENESSADDDESVGEAETNTNRAKRSRIIAAFEDDSADEMPSPNAQTSLALIETSLRSLDDSATEQNIGELPQSANTQMDEEKCRQAIIDDMKEFESRLLDTNTQVETPRKEATTSALFPDDDDDEEIGESQLMALCSGAFATQKPADMVASDETSNSAAPEIVDNVVREDVPIADLKSALLSSDDENIAEGGMQSKKKKSKKSKNKKLDYSDDDDDSGDNQEAEVESSEDEAEIEDEEVDLGERFVEYDSDENEVIAIKYWY